MLNGILTGNGSEVFLCHVDGVPQVGIFCSSDSKIHHNFVRHNTTVTNGYGLCGYAQKNVKVYSNVIIARNGRGIQLTPGKCTGWEVYDNYIEVREINSFKVIHGLKMEYPKNAHVHDNTVVAISTTIGQPTTFNSGMGPKSNCVLENNTFVALRVTKPAAYAFYTQKAAHDNTVVVRQNAFYSNDWLVCLGKGGGKNITFDRCAFHKVTPEDKTKFISFVMYRQPGDNIRFIDCLFGKGVDPKINKFAMGPSWARDGDYHVGWTVRIKALKGGAPVAGVKFTITDKDGKEVVTTTSNAKGEALVTLLEFGFKCVAAEKKVTELKPGPYNVSVKSVDGVAFVVLVDPKGPTLLKIDLGAKTAQAKARKGECPEEPKEKPFWRIRAEWALKNKK